MQPTFPSTVADAIRAVARERSLAVAADTHYDAENMEVYWWNGQRLHRVDFQPMPEGHVVVTSLVDTYPFLGRTLRWAWRSIPMFPYLAKTKHHALGTLQPPFAPPLEAKIHEYLGKAA